MYDPTDPRQQAEREEALRPGPLGDRPYLLIALVVVGFLGVALLGVTGPRSVPETTAQSLAATSTPAGSGVPLRLSDGSVHIPQAFLTPNPAYVPGLINLHVNEADVTSMDLGSSVMPVAAKVKLGQKTASPGPTAQAISGKEADDDFIIYPAQLVMVPGDEVGVQVRWIGEPALDAERAYTLVAREVPIPRKSGEESAPSVGIRVDITVLINYEVRIYVAPPGAKPKVVVESVTDRPPPAGAGPAASTQLEIILANQGTTHA